MKRRSLFMGMASALALSLGMGGQVAAQDAFPSKTITMVVPSAAGGATDLAARKTAEKMSEFLGQTVIVDNRPGAANVVGTRHVLDADADGYTIIAMSNALSVMPFIVKDLGFEPLEALRPVGVMLQQTNVYSVGQESPFMSFTDLIDYSKEHPEEVMFATGGPGSPQNISVEMVKVATGAKMQAVQYKGAGASFPDVMAGRVTLISSGYSGQVGFYENGQLRPLAVSGGKRIESLPDVPTLKELGIDVETQAWLGILVRSETPDEVVEKLSAALKFALDDPARQEEILREGSDPTFLTPDEFHELLVAEQQMFSELAPKIGLEPQ